MTTYFLDTSVIVKRYLNEQGSERINTLVLSDSTIAIAHISAVETLAALSRRRKISRQHAAISRAAIAEFERDFVDEQYDIVDINKELIVKGMALAKRHALRGYDAVQLAAAVTLRDKLEDEILIFVCADAELCQCAKKEGLLIEQI